MSNHYLQGEVLAKHPPQLLMVLRDVPQKGLTSSQGQKPAILHVQASPWASQTAPQGSSRQQPQYRDEGTALQYKTCDRLFSSPILSSHVKKNYHDPKIWDSSNKHLIHYLKQLSPVRFAQLN